MKIIEQSVKSVPFNPLWVIPFMNEIGSKGNLATTIPYNNKIKLNFIEISYLVSRWEMRHKDDHE